MGAQNEISKLREQINTQGYEIKAKNSGYLQSINHELLLKHAIKHNAIISFTLHPGQFVFENTVLAKVIPKEKGLLLLQTFNKAVLIGSNRALNQDPEFAIAQIVEIGIRALSPAINDTFTGIASVDWLSNAILTFENLPTSNQYWQDKTGKVYLIELPRKFQKLVSGAFDMMRQAGASNPAILIRMLQNFIRLEHYLTSHEDYAPILGQVEAIHEDTLLQQFTKTDQLSIAKFYEAAKKALSSIIKMWITRGTDRP